MNRLGRVTVILLAAAVVAGGFWFAAHSRKVHSAGAVSVVSAGGADKGSSGSTSDVTQSDPRSVRTALSQNPSQPVAGGGGSGGRQAPTAPSTTPPRDLAAALKNAFSGNATNDVSALLKMLLDDPKGNAAAIIALAHDETLLPNIRAMMLKLMGGLRDTASLDALVQLSETLSDPILRAESVKALGQRPEHEAEARLRVIADDAQDPARAMATSLLGIGAARESQELLAGQLTNPASSPELRNAALYAMRRYDDQATVTTLMQAANDPSVSAKERATALYSLGVIGNSNALPAVKANLNSPDREVRYSAALAATRVSDPQVSATLVTSLCDIGNFPHVRKAASAALVRNATATDLETLRLDVQITDGFGIRLACDVFAAKRDKAAIPILQSLAGKISDSYVHQRIEEAIESIERGEP